MKPPTYFPFVAYYSSLFMLWMGWMKKNAIWLRNEEWRPLFTSLLMLMSQAYHYSTLFYYTAFFTLSLAKRRIEVNKSEGMMNPYFITVTRCCIKMTCCRQGQKLGVNGERVGAYFWLPPSLHNWVPALKLLCWTQGLLSCLISTCFTLWPLTRRKWTNSFYS